MTSTAEAQLYQQHIDTMKARADRFVAAVQNTGQPRLARMLDNAAHELFDNENPEYFRAIENLKRVPVTISEFLDSKEFFRDNYEEIWPVVRDDLHRINPDILAGEKAVGEYLDGGATSTAKSFKAMATQAYQLYTLTCFKRPQSLARLTPATPIVFMFQSLSEGITRRVLYEPFRQMFINMPYVKKWVRYDKYRETMLFLEGNLQVIPALATTKHMVGQAILSGILDEVNFMTVVEKSKLVMGKGSGGGKYDQAEIAYNTISRRRKGRFISRGPMPGCITVMSSTRYKDDFLDRRIDFAEKARREDADPRMTETLVFRRAQYDVWPQDRYSGERFDLLIGSDNYGTRILKETDVRGETYPESATVESVPVEYYDEFARDPENALRDIVGVATDTIHPFITQRHKVIEAVIRGRERGLKQWVNKPNTVLEVDGMPQIIEANLPLDKDTPRFAHIDLSKTGDRCGITVSKIDGYTNVERQGHLEAMPHHTIELAISIQPSVTRELDIAEVRNWVLSLKTFYGLNIYMVSYDGYQSTESIQAVRRAGLKSQLQSMDITTEPYDDLKRAFYEDRVDMVDNELARVELTNLEVNEKTGKIDHTPRGSKDISDSMAGATFRAARSRIYRTDHTLTDTQGREFYDQRRTDVERRDMPRRRDSKRR